MRAVVAQLNKLFAEPQNILLKLQNIAHCTWVYAKKFQKSENVTFSFQLLQEVEIVVFQVKYFIAYFSNNQSDIQ